MIKTLVISGFALSLISCGENKPASNETAEAPAKLDIMHLPDPNIKCAFYPALYEFDAIDMKTWNFIVAMNPEDPEKNTIFVSVGGEQRVLKHISTDRDRLTFQSTSGSPLEVVLAVVPNLDLNNFSPKMAESFASKEFRPFIGIVEVPTFSQEEPLIIKGFC